MEVATLKVGHFEVNYGDAHFRRSDNGMTLYNPFVGNYVIDAFTTEIGAEAYLRKYGFLAMVGMTGGEVKGMVQQPGKRGPTYLAKLGVDKQFGTDMRVRLTGSLYKKDRSSSGTLTSGDRAGSRYYSVIEPVGSSETTNAWSGAIQSGMKNNVTAFVINPFVKVGGVELFGNIETMTGAAANEPTRRTLRQIVGEGLYRFAGDKLYLGGRYNTVNGELAGITNDITVKRSQVGGGWFVTPNVLTKLEFVRQNYESSRRPTSAAVASSRASWSRASSPSDELHDPAGRGVHQPVHPPSLSSSKAESGALGAVWSSSGYIQVHRSALPAITENSF